MKHYFELKNAIEYIENHLMDNLKQTDIARSVEVSLSSLQKLFKHSLGYSINEYVMKRRMSEAATRLVLENAPVTDVALEYGYNTVESFSRAFHKVYGVLPSEYKKDARHGELFTVVDIFEDAVTRDCSRLVNVLRESKDSYVVCFDIVGIVQINDISRNAGDIAIITALQRIHKYTEEGFFVFRIGGDEFAVVTPFENVTDAEIFMNKVLKHNAETFLFDGMQIPVSVRGWIGKNENTYQMQRLEKELRDKVKYQGRQ